MEKYIIKKINKKSIIISILLILAGFLISIISGSINLTYLLSKFILFIGIVLSATGLVIILFMNKSYYYKGSGSKINTRVLYFKPQDFNILNEYLTKGEYSKIATIKDIENTNIKVEFKYSSDKQFACYQVFRYVPFQYKEETEQIIIPENSVDLFVKGINS